MLSCAHDTCTLKCVAHVMSPSQAVLKLSALEAAEFDVYMPWFHSLANLQHHAIALGGLPVLVPKYQAEDALALLLQIEEADETARDRSDVMRAAPRSIFWRVVQALIYWLTATGPSMNLTFLTADRPAYGTDKTADFGKSQF